MEASPAAAPWDPPKRLGRRRPPAMAHQLAPSVNCSLDDIDLNALKVPSASAGHFTTQCHNVALDDLSKQPSPFVLLPRCAAAARWLPAAPNARRLSTIAPDRSGRACTSLPNLSSLSLRYYLSDAPFVLCNFEHNVIVCYYFYSKRCIFTTIVTPLLSLSVVYLKLLFNIVAQN